MKLYHHRQAAEAVWLHRQIQEEDARLLHQGERRRDIACLSGPYNMFSPHAF